MPPKGFAGAWKLDLNKSDIPPTTKSQVLTVETDGDNVSMREELVNDKDERLTIVFQGRFDGRDRPVTGTPFADTVAYRLLDGRTIEGIAKKDGRVCVKETAVLSEDENIVSVTYESYDEGGRILESRGIFKRVAGAK